MCQPDVYLAEGGQEKLLMQEAASLSQVGRDISVRSIMGEEKRVRARLREADFVEDRVVLEVEAPVADSLKELTDRAVLFHGHLGPFLVIGLRMGLLAKRALGFRGHFDVKVTAFTGRQTPISCIVDGLQVTTGATLGKGNIDVAEMRGGQPEARFEGGGKAVEVAIAPSALELVRSLLEKQTTEVAAEEIAGLPDTELFVAGEAR